jgi:uncharacterized protein
LSFAWRDLFTALALFLVLEGLLPFLNPAASQRLFAQLAQLELSKFRIAGLISMLVGLVMLFNARS